MRKLLTLVMALALSVPSFAFGEAGGSGKFKLFKNKQERAEYKGMRQAFRADKRAFKAECKGKRGAEKRACKKAAKAKARDKHSTFIAARKNHRKALAVKAGAAAALGVGGVAAAGAVLGAGAVAGSGDEGEAATE